MYNKANDVKSNKGSKPRRPGGQKQNVMIQASDIQEGSFVENLYAETERYFRQQRSGRYAKRSFYSKSIVFICIYISAYILFIFYATAFWQMILLALILGVSHVFIPVNIAHDAIHNAISPIKWINVLGLYGLEITGGNAYMYAKKHLEAQRDHENGSKTKAIEHQALVLQRKNADHKVNLPGFFYLFFALYMIYVRDFVLYFQSRDSIPIREFLKMFFWKICYTIAFLVLPFVLMEAPWYQILISLFFMYLVITAALVIILLMPTERMESTRTDESLGHNEKWIREILEHNVDFSPRNSSLSMLTGAANLNVVHHLFPDVNHVHYFHLSGIIEKTAHKHGLQYRKQLVKDVFGIHLKYMKNIQKSS